MSGRRIEALLLDMGGVLLEMGNSAGMPQGKLDYRGREAMAQAIREAGGKVGVGDLEEVFFAPWRREYARRYDTGREARFEPHLRRLRKATGAALRASQLLAAWFGPYGETLAPAWGVAEALRTFAGSGLRMAIVSNVPLPGALYRRALRRHRLDRPISSFQWSYDAGSRKPSPAMLRAALAALEVPAERALMVGDRRRSDVAAGRAAGVRTVWVRSADGGGPRADWEIESLAELPALVGSIS
jgi:HAD superfamily hydrolase (TIGR01549 family)